MAKGRKSPISNTNPSNGGRTRDKSWKDGQSLTASDHPGSLGSENETKKLSEAVGGDPPGASDQSIVVPEHIQTGRENSRLWGRDDVDRVLQEVDTKCGSRISGGIYRSLSQTSDEKWKLSEAVGGVPPGASDQSIVVPEDIQKGRENSRLWGSDDTCMDRVMLEVDTKSGSRPSRGIYRSLSQTSDKELDVRHNTDEGMYEVKRKFVALNDKKEHSTTCDSSQLQVNGIRLSETASFEKPSKEDSSDVFDAPTLRDWQQSDVRLDHSAVHDILDKQTYKCTDAGGVLSVISGCTEDQTCLPFSVKSDNQDYRRQFNNLRRKSKTDLKKRLILRNESGCLSKSCLHPENNHDWSNHNTKKKQIYTYAAPRTGHIFQREMNTNHYMETGTCCHIGDGYILTCYHCIESLLSRNGWQNEWLLQTELAVAFPDLSFPGTRKTHSYRLEPSLYAYSAREDLDFALLRLDQPHNGQIPLAFTRHTEDNVNQEVPLYIAGYQMHPKHIYGKLSVDASALKFPLQTLDLHLVDRWSKMLKGNFQASIEKIHNGRCPLNWTYYPVTRCGKNFPVLTSLIFGASGGFGLTYTAPDDPPVVNLMLRAGYPTFYYNSHYVPYSDVFEQEHQHIRNNFSPCWTFQEGVPIGPIVKEIQKSPDTSLNKIPFLLPDS